MPGLNLNIPATIGSKGVVQSDIVINNGPDTNITLKVISDSDYYTYIVPEKNSVGINRNENNDIIISGPDLTPILHIVPILSESINLVPDDNIYELIQPKSSLPPTIETQPTEFFRSSESTDFTPGNEIFIDSSAAVNVLKGTIFKLNINVSSNDIPTLRFEWKNTSDDTLGTDSFFEINTNESLATQTIYCKVIDSLGSITSKPITVNVIDPNQNNFLFKNVVKNSCAEEGINYWNLSNNNSNVIGFYPTTFIMPGYAYHLFDSQSFHGTIIPSNEWFPKPENFEKDNPIFAGKVAPKINFGRYFRGGTMYPRDSFNNDISDLRKDMYQDIDISDIGELIDGKVYGIPAISTTLFAWLGTRGDQGDTSIVEIEFYNENGELILQDPDNLSIHSGGTEVSIIQVNNDIYQKEPVYSSLVHQGGQFGSGNYVGLLYTDKESQYQSVFTEEVSITTTTNNTGPERSQAHGDGTSTSTITEEVTFWSTIKTVVLGRKIDPVTIPIGTRKIRVYLKFYHLPITSPIDGKVLSPWDLLVTLKRPTGSEGTQYISEAMATGINIILYPSNFNFEVNYIDVFKETGITI